MVMNDPAEDMTRYWEKRLKENWSLSGVGHLGLHTYFNYWIYKAKKRALERILNLMNIDYSRARILDIGAGTGYFEKFWYRKGVGNVTAIDFTAASVFALRKKYPEYEIGQVDISDKQAAATGNFDIIMALDVLYHIKSEVRINRAIRNISKLAGATGVLVFTDILPLDGSIITNHEHYRTMGNYKKLFEKHGMKIVDVNPVYIFLNTPIDRGRINKRWMTKFLRDLWQITLLLNGFSKQFRVVGEVVGFLWGACLFFIDCILLAKVESGPSTKMVLVKRVS